MKNASALLPALLLAASGALAQSAPPPLSADAHIDTVTVEAPKTPLEKAVDGFIKSYAAPSVMADKIPKWASGICPLTQGLAANLDLAVTVELKLVAAQVGAPVETREPCDANVTIIFTKTPQALLDDIARNHEDLLGWHEVSQLKSVSTMRHPIQAWYATATRDDYGILHTDRAQRSPQCDTAWASFSSSGGGRPTFDPKNPAFHDVFQSCNGMQITGNHVNDGLKSEFNNVTIIVDGSKIGEMGIKSVANYIAMLALSQTQTFEACQPLPSIANLLTPGCDASLKPDTLSESDLAYLKALYHTDPGVMLTGQQSSIARQMETALGGH